MGKLVLVTGASSGIGHAIALRLARDGHRVLGTGRMLRRKEESGVTMFPLDVRDEESIVACKRFVEGRGPLDVLVNCAGIMAFGPIEELEFESARRVFETNFWGAARMTRAFLPDMRARRQGLIINVGSVAGKVAIPLNGWYAASKHALAGWTEALRHEVAHLGIHVTLVEPADYKSHLWRDGAIVPAHIPDYAALRAQVLEKLETMLKLAPDPDPVAACLAGIVAEHAPRGRYAVGAAARVLPRLRALLPTVYFEQGVRRRFGLDQL